MPESQSTFSDILGLAASGLESLVQHFLGDWYLSQFITKDRSILRSSKDVPMIPIDQGEGMRGGTLQYL